MKILNTSKKIGIIFLILVSSFSFFSFTAFASESTESGLQVVELGFNDVPREHDFYVAITLLNKQGVINGYSDGSFKPDNSINRAEVLKIIMEGSGIDTSGDFGLNTFPDVSNDAWFFKYVMKGKDLGIVTGNANDGTFAPARQINKAEFLKMLLETNRIKQEALDAVTATAPDVSSDAWYAAYVNYSASVGIIAPDANGNLNPGKILTRGEVANMMYLMNLIKSQYNTQFLLDCANMEMGQIDVYIASNDIERAKYSSELALDLGLQAYNNMPEDKVVLGVAKLAKAYDFAVSAYVYAIQEDYAAAEDMANQAIDKAGEAWEVNNDTQLMSRHIKDIARGILAQIGAQES